MALSILDGNQSATTLSTILSSGQHITAHTVVSLGTQAITDMRGAVSGSVVSISNFPASQVISGTVTANPTGTQTIAGTVTANIGNLGAYNFVDLAIAQGIRNFGESPEYSIPVINESGQSLAISGTVDANLITSTAYDSGDDSININIKNIGTSVAGVGSSLPISGTVTANTFAVQGTAVTTSNFTSTTASTVLANFNATREVLTIFNEGAGNLHICAGATCTTIAYQVRLGAGDYYEVPLNQTSLTHSAVFATAGTARIVQIS
jgi:hypothetical protein